MDAVVLVVIGAMVLALVGYAGADVVGSLRERRHRPAAVASPPPVPTRGPRRVVLLRSDDAGIPVRSLPPWAFDAVLEPEATGAAELAELTERADDLLRSAGAHAGDVLVVAAGPLLRVVAARWLGLHPAAGRLLVLDTGAFGVLGHDGAERVLLQWNVSASAGAPPPAAR